MGPILDMLSPTVYKLSVFLFTPGNLGTKPLKWLMTWIYMKMQNLWKFPYAQSKYPKQGIQKTGPDAWDNFLQWWCHQNFFLLLMLISTTVLFPQEIQ